MSVADVPRRSLVDITMTKSALSLRDDPNFGVDSRWSWITACFCGVVLFMGTATTRIAGIFFYGIIETFGVNREEASWPVSLAGTMLLLGGPIVGVLCRRFSCRAVLLSCSLVTGATVCTCYLAPNVAFITIVFGILHGTAMSGLYVATNVLVAQHFEKRRTTACSLLFTASGLNTAALSPLVEYFRTTFGIRAAFLLYGAVLLNAFPAAIPLRSPQWLKKSVNTSQKKETPLRNQTKVDGLPLDPSVPNTTQLVTSKDSGCESRLPPARNCAQIPCGVVERNNNHTLLTILKEPPQSSEIKKKVRLFRLNRTTKQFLTLRFLVHALSFSAVIFIMGVFVMIPADLAKDRGLDPSNSVYILQAFAVGDIVFRAFSGLAIDSRLLSLESVMLLGYVLQGIACEWLVWAKTLPTMIIAAGIFGSTCGSRMALQAPALVKDFGIGSLPMMMGGLSFCVGACLLSRPPLIGYYRDHLGDYIGLLHLLAGINLVFIVVWSGKLIASWRRSSALTSKVTTSDKVSSDTSAAVAPENQSKLNNMISNQASLEELSVIPTENRASTESPKRETILPGKLYVIPVAPTASTDLKLASSVTPVGSPSASMDPRGETFSLRGTDEMCEEKLPPSKEYSREYTYPQEPGAVAEERPNESKSFNKEKIVSEVVDVTPAEDQNNGDCQETCITHL